MAEEFEELRLVTYLYVCIKKWLEEGLDFGLLGSAINEHIKTQLMAFLLDFKYPVNVSDIEVKRGVMSDIDGRRFAGVDVTLYTATRTIKCGYKFHQPNDWVVNQICFGGCEGMWLI